MKALVEKDILMKKQEKEMRKAPQFFYVHLSRGLKGSACRINGRKKTQEKGQRRKISQMTQEEEEEEKRKHRSAPRALKN